MTGTTRRGFLADVGRGMFVAGLGPSLACDLGLATTSAAEADPGPARLSFGPLEPLVSLLQETPADRLLPELVSRVRSGTDLGRLTAAAALANARTFGGEHYRGFHAFMALLPAYQMAAECPDARRPLPVLKVIHRNVEFIQTTGGIANEVLHPVAPAALSDPSTAGARLREANRRRDVAEADRIFAAMAEQPTQQAFEDLLQFNVEDHASVHEVVLVWRAWAMLDLTGPEYAHTLLRQSVRQCVDHSEKQRPPDPRHTLLPRLIDEYRLTGSRGERRTADDDWTNEFCETVLASRPDQAAEAAAAALAEGFSAEQVGEALSLASTQLVLRQVENWEGVRGQRTHGDSPGVHASDAVNAWRNIARIGDARTAAASMILAAYFVADSHRPSDGKLPRGHEAKPFPRPEQLDPIAVADPTELLTRLDGAVRENDQLGACALVHRYGALGHATRPVFDLLLRYAISEDGRLHGEKYYRTVAEEWAAARPAFRWNYLTALARVTASGYGYDLDDRRSGRAAGYEELCGLLSIDA